MSRIDEALNRVGLTADRPFGSNAPADVFVSPWHVGRGDDHDRHEAAGEAAVPAPEREPRTPAGAATESVRASLERFETDWRGRLAVSATADPLLADQFRRLAGTLLHNPAKLKSIMVTSACPGDGKTLTALNLALMLSESYKRKVLLIEGDLRRPALAEAVGIKHATPHGLNETLKSPEITKPALIRLTDLLTLMPAGRPDPDPLSGVTSTRFQQLIQEATEEFDWVILDTPPIGAAPDAALMLAHLDAALLVIRARATPLQMIRQAIDALGSDRIMGVVLNAIGRDAAPASERYYGHYYAAS